MPWFVAPAVIGIIGVWFVGGLNRLTISTGNAAVKLGIGAIAVAGVYGFFTGKIEL